MLVEQGGYAATSPNNIHNFPLRKQQTIKSQQNWHRVPLLALRLGHGAPLNEVDLSGGLSLGKKNGWLFLVGLVSGVFEYVWLILFQGWMGMSMPSFDLFGLKPA